MIKDVPSSLPFPTPASAAMEYVLVVLAAALAAQLRFRPKKEVCGSADGASARGGGGARVDKPDKEKGVERISVLPAGDELARTKRQLIDALRSGPGGGGRTKATDPHVAKPLGRLREAYRSYGGDCRVEEADRHAPYDGDYVMEHNPSFLGLMGHNSDGDPMYSMGRMSFSMIRPTDAVCSIQRVTQHVHRLGRRSQDGRWDLPRDIPAKLRDAVEARAGELRTFLTYMDFTVEDGDPKKKRKDMGAGVKSKRPRGVMRVDGYAFPHPEEPNRYAIWFSGGDCRPKTLRDAEAWREVFGGDLPSYTASERLMLFAARMMMGAEPSEGIDGEGTLSFAMRRPVPAHQDVVYLDDELRITVGHAGTLVVVSRLPEGSAPLSCTPADEMHLDDI